MADYATVSRVAKILARATSPEENEAKSALDHAYKRMVRDGVTLQDLLTLPEAELFQDALVRLVDVILSNQADLSPSAKRAAYAEYMRLIVAKFSGAGQSSTAGESSREEQARAYRERHGYQERQEQSRRAEAGPGASVPPGTRSFWRLLAYPTLTPCYPLTSCSVRISAPPDGVQREAHHVANEKELAWMLKPELLTALHYCAVITLTGAITSEYFLFRRGMSIEQVRKLLLADSLAALALLLIFITGVLLVVAHPQPPAILFANPGYRTKLLMFFAMAISFGYPSRLFHHWRRSLRQGRAPLVSTQQQFWVIWILRGNLLLLALLPLLAKLASR